MSPMLCQQSSGAMRESEIFSLFSSTLSRTRTGKQSKQSERFRRIVKRSGQAGWHVSSTARVPRKRAPNPRTRTPLPRSRRIPSRPNALEGSSLDTLRAPRISRGRSRVPTAACARASFARPLDFQIVLGRASFASGRQDDPEPRGTRARTRRASRHGGRGPSQDQVRGHRRRRYAARFVPRTLAARDEPRRRRPCDPPGLFPSTRSLTPSARAASASRRSQTRRRAGSAWTITRTSSSDRASARAGCVFLPRDPRRSPPRSVVTIPRTRPRRRRASRRADESRALVVPSRVVLPPPLLLDRVPDPSLAPRSVRRRCTRDAWRVGSFSAAASPRRVVANSATPSFPTGAPRSSATSCPTSPPPPPPRTTPPLPQTLTLTPLPRRP